MKLSRKSLLLGATILGVAFATTMMDSQKPRAAEAMNKDQVEKIVKQYLMDNPDIIIDAINKYNDNQQSMEEKKFQDTLKTTRDELHSGDLPFAGNPKGDVTVVEFFDYNCGYCKRAIDDVTEVLQKDKNVKFIFHDMPILSQSSSMAARYALAAQKQGKYFEYHKALMHFNGSKTEDNLKSVAKDLGLDVDKLEADANSDEIRAKIKASLTMAQKLGIRGTPAFIIGNQLAPGYMTSDSMLEMIKKARDDNNKG